MVVCRSNYTDRSLYKTPKSPFREALRCILHKNPPKYVRGYSCGDLTEQETDLLQQWCVNAIVVAGYEWMTGIGCIEAAELMVRCAVENGNILPKPTLKKPTKD